MPDAAAPPEELPEAVAIEVGPEALPLADAPEAAADVLEVAVLPELLEVAVPPVAPPVAPPEVAFEAAPELPEAVGPGGGGGDGCGDGDGCAAPEAEVVVWSLRVWWGSTRGPSSASNMASVLEIADHRRAASASPGSVAEGPSGS